MPRFFREPSEQFSLLCSEFGPFCKMTQTIGFFHCSVKEQSGAWLAQRGWCGWMNLNFWKSCSWSSAESLSERVPAEESKRADCQRPHSGRTQIKPLKGWSHLRPVTAGPGAFINTQYIQLKCSFCHWCRKRSDQEIFSIQICINMGYVGCFCTSSYIQQRHFVPMHMVVNSWCLS